MKQNDTNNHKIFDDFPIKDCNDCAHYWDNTCDSPKTLQKGSNTLCNSFLVTRRVVLPLQIKRLNKAIKLLIIATAILGVMSTVTLVITLLMILGVW